MTKPKIAHNCLNNWVRAVLTPFLDFQFFWTFWLENLFFWGKNQKWTKKAISIIGLKYPKFVQNHVQNWENWWIYYCIFDPKKGRKLPDFLLKSSKSSKFFRFLWGGGYLIFEFHKTKNAHNSLNNGVRAVLTPFLDFQFFWAFWLENLFFGDKIQNLTKKAISIMG